VSFNEKRPLKQKRQFFETDGLEWSTTVNQRTFQTAKAVNADRLGSLSKD